MKLSTKQLRELVLSESKKLMNESNGFYSKKYRRVETAITHLDKAINTLISAKELEMSTAGEEDTDIFSAILDAQDLREFLVNILVAVEPMKSEENL